jgi:hypothetical protein
LRHRVESALGCGAIGIGDAGDQGARRDLPRQTPPVLSPAACTFLAAVADDRVPKSVGLGLIVGFDLERKGLVVLERRAAVQAGRASCAETIVFLLITFVLHIPWGILNKPAGAG